MLCAAVLFSRRCRRSRSKQVRVSLMRSILNKSEMLKHSFDAKGRNSPPGFLSLFLVSIPSVCQSKSCCAGLATKCWLRRAFVPIEFLQISRDICKEHRVFLPFVNAPLPLFVSVSKSREKWRLKPLQRNCWPDSESFLPPFSAHTVLCHRLLCLLQCTVF